MYSQIAQLNLGQEQQDIPHDRVGANNDEGK